MKLTAKELRNVDKDVAIQKSKSISRAPIFIILEDVYDTYNIGGLFRLADAVAASKIYLCGDCEVPPNHKIKKASVGTYKVVPWEYRKMASDAISELRLKTKNTIQIIGVEQDSRAKDYREIQYSSPLALIVGNETYGVKKETLDLCDYIAEIPMYGINTSLNVIVATSIVSYYATDQLQRT